MSKNTVSLWNVFSKKEKINLKSYLQLLPENRYNTILYKHLLEYEAFNEATLKQALLPQKKNF